jgi:hypothetical protein
VINITIIAVERWGTATASSLVAAPVGLDNGMDWALLKLRQLWTDTVG